MKGKLFNGFYVYERLKILRILDYKERRSSLFYSTRKQEEFQPVIKMESDYKLIL